MPFHKFYYHVVWSTKHRQLLISPKIEAFLHVWIPEKIIEMNGQLFALGVMPDHIHLAVFIPPSIAVGEWIGILKGASSHTINQRFPNEDEHFRWQEGYGAFTFAEKQLLFICDYINTQKSHHTNNILYALPEKTEA